MITQLIDFQKKKKIKETNYYKFHINTIYSTSKVQLQQIESAKPVPYVYIYSSPIKKKLFFFIPFVPFSQPYCRNRNHFSFQLERKEKKKKGKKTILARR